MNTYFVYILTNKKYGSFYTGITSELKVRVWQHKEKIHEGFTKKYRTDKLVWFEIHQDVALAIKREKLIKRWKKQWKIELIEKENKEWKDLYTDL